VIYPFPGSRGFGVSAASAASTVVPPVSVWARGGEKTGGRKRESGRERAGVAEYVLSR
jgi:hypothetical protein